ncbi:hypothetical protein FHS29_007013 [Saccharothrix tamanrassetensis]|uniref:S-adenosyl methyltransferase n=1 Tax=Saccharothrix tamanrassetensis TaxID=1051531 RepID=A0A841CSZ2_9PSEU|nr:SAM-dependent methyltransferase [Saccharothrix tamanrassetensis]MBB5960390.1 hypothetical protein [Saccharothrix tamanrassetensis]
MVRSDWVPQNVDISVPSAARAYDFMLGGAHNFAVDREVARKINALMPGSRAAARVNRAFLGRAVRFMAERGIRQFLDIGSGIPTVANVHEVAHSVAPECRVVYVDKDPIAVAHSELILADEDRADIVRADMRDVDGILNSPQVRGLLDFDQPVGLLMLLMLHWLRDEWGPAELVARYRDALPDGSYLAVSHASDDHVGTQLRNADRAMGDSGSADRITPREHSAILAMLDGFDLVEPGLVGAGEWRPTGPGDISDMPDMNMLLYVAVGRVRR